MKESRIFLLLPETDEFKRLVRVQERIENSELKYLAGEITQEQLEATKRRLMGILEQKKHLNQITVLVAVLKFNLAANSVCTAGQN